MQKSISFKHLHNTQEGWREEAGGRHGGPEQFHRTCSFQNGRSFALAISPLERGFYVQDRSARRVSNHSNCKKIKDLFKVSLERETVPVHMSTFWPQILSENFYKRLLLVYLRTLGIHLLVYLDDILTMAATPELYLEHTQLTWQLLTDLGFLENLKKSVLTPKQQTEYLGFLMNPIEMKLFLMEEKLLRSKLETECLLKSNPVVKMLASFLGFFQSTLPANAVAPLYFRKLQADMIKAIKGLRGRQGYRSVVHLSPEAKAELEWWRDHLKMKQWQKHFAPRKNKRQYSQMPSSKGEVTFESGKNRGRWIWGEKVDTHTNILELKAAFFALQAFPQLKQQHIQFGMDNKTAVAYINKLGGTHSHRLTSLALEMWNFAADRKLTLSAVYVPGEENHIADKKSRENRCSLEWMLHPAVFQALQKEAGCFDIDLFATHVNHQVPAFVSWRPEPGAVATDAFNVKWDF